MLDRTPVCHPPIFVKSPLVTVHLLAVGNGHEEVVKMLLKCEKINPNQVGIFYNWKPLSSAAVDGYKR